MDGAFISDGLRDYRGREIRDGDDVIFMMPGVVSGQYKFTAVKDENGLLVFKNSPSNILDRCYGFEIIKKRG